MNKMLKNIATELNPAHDFDNIRFHNHVNIDSLVEKAKVQLKNHVFFLNLAKPITRGGIIGGTIGAIGNYVAGNPVGEGFARGAVIGAYLDLAQYMARGLYYYVREQIRPSD